MDFGVVGSICHAAPSLCSAAGAATSPRALDSPTPSTHWEGLLPLSASPITRACWDTAHRTAPQLPKQGFYQRHPLIWVQAESLDMPPPLSCSESSAGFPGRLPAFVPSRLWRSSESPAERPPHVCTEHGGALGPPAHPRCPPHSCPLHWPRETMTGLPAPGTWSSGEFGLLPGRAWVWKPAPGPAVRVCRGPHGAGAYMVALPPSAPRAFGSNDLFSCRGVFQGTLDLVASLRQEPREGQGCAPDACRETRSTCRLSQLLFARRGPSSCSALSCAVSALGAGVCG